jgi:hypothetical protein
MKKILTVFFLALGVIFFILILLSIYLFVTDPLNLKPIFFGEDSSVMTEEFETDTETVVDKNPALNASQEKALETVGIDPADVPSEITPEQEQCFIDAIGADRVAEIKAGDTPTVTEIFKAKNCI